MITFDLVLATLGCGVVDVTDVFVISAAECDGDIFQQPVDMDFHSNSSVDAFGDARLQTMSMLLLTQKVHR